ncbi:MAG TPA: SH3 domain-containing protein [Phototrophicaceae bacterium]|jgi:hypothetical protein|nr:SH3 domain-containing protein [Phototrophicaceae bacterium]
MRIAWHRGYSIIVVLMVCLLANGSQAVIAQTNSQVVSIPVHGSMVLALKQEGPDSLITIDTYDGTIQTLVNNQNGLDSPIWNSTGNKIAYHSSASDGAFFDLNSGISQVIESFGDFSEDYFIPAGWASDDSTFLYNGPKIGANSIGFTFYLFDLNTQMLSPLISYTTNTALNTVLLPQGTGKVTLNRVSDLERNPVYDDWSVIQFDAAFPQEPSSEGSRAIKATVLWNYQTGQMIPLNELFTDNVLEFPFDWSPDGNYLLLSTSVDRNLQSHIVHFQPDTTTVDVVGSGLVPENRIPEYLMGAGDLILGRDWDFNRYYIGEIIDGKWHETEFLHLGDEIGETFASGDWFINASDEEKKTLSCTFDETLTTKLESGVQGQVKFAGDLHTEPGTYTDVVSQLAVGATFTVLNTPECRSGYRWWQIQLIDGTTGYAAEASKNTYFLEPAGD